MVVPLCIFFISECNCYMNLYVRLSDSLIGDKGVPFNMYSSVFEKWVHYENLCRLPVTGNLALA